MRACIAPLHWRRCRRRAHVDGCPWAFEGDSQLHGGLEVRGSQDLGAQVDIRRELVLRYVLAWADICRAQVVRGRGCTDHVIEGVAIVFSSIREVWVLPMLVFRGMERLRIGRRGGMDCCPWLVWVGQ